MKQHQQPNSIFESVDPNGLKPHPSYWSIYGEAEDISDLIALIQNKQYPRPLLVNQEKIIVNGHLYWKAALSLGWNSIKSGSEGVFFSRSRVRSFIVGKCRPQQN